MKKQKLIFLGIETSCDDTSIAITKNNHVISLVTKSSLAKHAKYGGIVPEIAARNHEAKINDVFKQVITKSKISAQDIDVIAYASEPGLAGSIHVGKVFAKTLAFLLNKPLLAIDHILAHAWSATINNDAKITFPIISLVASGGHTTIYYFTSYKNYQILNKTIDDACGEALDKIGRKLNLKYPGGISIDQIYNSKKSNLKLIRHFQPQENFSFSGIKSHIINLINQKQIKNEEIDQVEIASSFLKWVCDEIIIKLNYYINLYHPKAILVGGGVSANTLLRNSLKTLNIPVIITEKKFTSDNAAMIANYADKILKESKNIVKC